MLQEILPAAVAAAEEFGDPPGAALFPEEEAVIARAVGQRRREFATARACARQALAQLGLPPAPITAGPRGEPQWPAGVVGSITHCAGYRASAVACARDVLSIGLDAEPDGALPAGVLRRVAAPGEQARLAALAAAQPGVSWDRLLFSAKESAYKAWFPLAHRWLGFLDASIDIDPDAGTFSVRLLVDGPPVHGRPLARLTGRWLARDGLLVTAIVLPAEPADPAGPSHGAGKPARFPT